MPKSHEVWSEAQFVSYEGGNSTSTTHKYTTSSNEELFPIACVQCRKLHKRCDKKLPSCSKCISKGLTCTYKEPKKKGRTKGSKNHATTNSNENNQQQTSSGDNTPSPNGHQDDNSNENQKSSSPTIVENIPPQHHTVASSLSSNVKTPYGTNLVNISNNLVNTVLNPITSVENMLSQNPSFLRTMRMNLIDAYYEIVSLGYPLIERSELERYMFSQEELNDRKEILAFVLSIQGMCQQRFGYSDLATDSIEKSALVLKECFDGYSDFYIAATYSNFAYYYIGEGDTKKSRFYNHFVEFYLKELDEFSTIYQQNLRWIKLLVDYLGNPRFPYLSPADLIGFFKSVADKDMPAEWKEALYDFAGINTTNCEERLAIYHSISDSMQQMRRGSLVSSIIYDVIYGVLKTGLSISIYSFVDLIHFRQTVFDLIVKMFNISDNEYFSFTPPIVIPYMVVSAKILLEMEKVIATGELNTNGIDYYSLLSKCNRALNILAKRYRAISISYSSIIQQLNTVLSNRYQSYETYIDYSIPVTIPQTKSKISRLVEFDSEIKTFFLPFVHPLIEHNMLTPKPFVTFAPELSPSQSTDTHITNNSPNPFMENNGTILSFYHDPLLTDEIIACLEGFNGGDNDEFL